MKTRKSLEHLTALKIDAKQATSLFDPTEYADLLFGVGSATSAGPTFPSGSIHPSPETLINDCGGYTREQPIIGFGHAYTSGAGGTKCYGNFLICPTIDILELDHAKRASLAIHGTEFARCYEYSVALENGIKIRVTPSHSCAIYEIEYPANTTAYLMMDAAHKLDIDAAMKEGSVTLSASEHRISGGGLFFGNWNKMDWRMYFAMEYDEKEESVGVFCGDDIKQIAIDSPHTESISECKRLGAFVNFGYHNVPFKLTVKVSISFTSERRAIDFLNEKIIGFDYYKAKSEARAAWHELMSAIELKSDDEALLRRFYTAMYHMNVQPRNRMSDSGLWDDFHTIWDTWKTVFPMYSLIYPEKMGSIVDSFIDRAKKNEATGLAIVLGDEMTSGVEFIPGQGGNDIENAIADAYLRGVTLKRHDWDDAYGVLKRSAENMRSPEYVSRGFATDNAVTVSGAPYSFRFKSAAATMGFAFNDKAVATVAKELGTKEEFERYEARSSSWLNVWNKALVSEGFTGFPQSPNPDGSFAEGFDAHGGYNKHFYEATAWDASYINYNDIKRLIETMGGAEKFTERLLWACEHSVNYYNDDNGKEGYLNFTNEPSFQIPWLFCVDGIQRPDLAAKVIDGIISRFTRDDDYPGDDDNGGMSSYYIFLMCGFFPFATTEYYYLHGTRVEKIVFRLGNGRTFTVSGDNVKAGNIYVQSATWQGTPLNECKLTHAQILEGGELHFVMGNVPSDWARI